MTAAGSAADKCWISIK